MMLWSMALSRSPAWISFIARSRYTSTSMSRRARSRFLSAVLRLGFVLLLTREEADYCLGRLIMIGGITKAPQILLSSRLDLFQTFQNKIQALDHGFCRSSWGATGTLPVRLVIAAANDAATRSAAAWSGSSAKCAYRAVVFDWR